MTVSTSYAPLSFVGNGSTTAFSVTWPFLSGTLIVTLVASTGVETVKTIGTHYTVSGGTDSNGLPATGTVTMLTAPAAGEVLRITRGTTKTQASSWADNDPFPAKTIEAALDKLTLIAQEGGGGGGASPPAIDGDVMRLETSGANPDYWDAADYIMRNLADPVDGTDAVTKNYGDTYYGGSAASAAAASATSASNSVTAAAASAAAASASASSAASSATNASNSATAAAAAYDAFDDRYLGAKSSDPLVDNDGNALADGAFYWSTVAKKFKTYDLATDTFYQDNTTFGPRSFPTVPDFVSDNVLSYSSGSGLVSVVAGEIVEAGGYTFVVASSGATDQQISNANSVKLYVIGGVANADQLGITTGTVSDAVALTNAQKINAWLATGEGYVFDWRADEIGIAESIRLSLHGNQIIGRPGQRNFHVAAQGARAKWQGASAGVMVDIRHRSTTDDIRSPAVYGLSLDGNSLAGIGFSFVGCYKPRGDMLHVANLRDNASSYAYNFGSNKLATGSHINCCYGGSFGSLTATLGGSANGFLLSGISGASGKNTTFNQFSYCHVTCYNGYSFVFQKGDDNVFQQLAVSRIAGGTNGDVLFNTQAANSFVWVGNVIHNMNLSKSDGPAIKIIVNDNRCMGNSTTYNGVDYVPSLVLNGGSLRSHNQWTFLGSSNYAGGWGTEPSQNLFPLPNVDDTNPKILDWYEEATPTLGVTFGGGSTGMTFSATSMRSRRVGNMIEVHGSFTMTAKGSSTGSAAITGLPVAAVGLGNAMCASLYINFAAGITAPPMGLASGTTIALYKAGAGSASAMTDADFTNNSRIDFTINYRVA